MDIPTETVDREPSNPGDEDGWGDLEVIEA